MSEPMSFEDAVKRIDEIAKDLENEPKEKTIIELRKLCGHHRTVPTAYKLEGVLKEGICPFRLSPVTELWRGRYKDEEVVLKVLRVSQDDPDIQRAKSRFCKEVVLMKQATHDNILPFYGVSTTVSDFCLVFPWYENGDVMDYLKNNPDVNRYDLLSGAVNGLRFLHDNHLVHGDLRPGHVLIDDNGNARLATAGRSSIVPVPDTSIADHVQSALDGGVDDYRYLAPEIQWPEEHGMDKILITKESDVYGMAMVIYQVLTEKRPYYKDNDSNILPKVQAGEIPERPSGRINDLVWGLLEKCWSKDPAKRPPVAEVYNALPNLNRSPQFTHTPQGRPATGGLPGKLKLQFQSIKFSLDKSKQQQFFVKLKYGNKDHRTSLTQPVDGSGEHTWSNPESWLVEINKQHHEQLISLELFLRTGVLKKDRVCATGNFSLPNNVNKESSVQLEALDSAGPAVLKIRLMEM